MRYVFWLLLLLAGVAFGVSALLLPLLDEGGPLWDEVEPEVASSPEIASPPLPPEIALPPLPPEFASPPEAALPPEVASLPEREGVDRDFHRRRQVEAAAAEAERQRQAAAAAGQAERQRQAAAAAA